jgi:hypothetical protein
MHTHARFDDVLCLNLRLCVLDSCVVAEFSFLDDAFCDSEEGAYNTHVCNWE